MPAASFFDSSLSWCSKMNYCTRDQVIRFLQRNCPSTHSSIRYALAKEFSRYLGEKHGNVRAVYVYGSTMQDTAGKMSDIDLIVLVDKKNNPLSSSIQIMNDQLIYFYRLLLGEETLPMHRILDVHIIDSGDVTARRGYGSLIGSLFEPPVKIWTRTEKNTAH